MNVQAGFITPVRGSRANEEPKRASREAATGTAHGESAHERSVESRLVRMGERIARRAIAPFFALMRDAEAVTLDEEKRRDAAERLAAEQASLLWIARIAKHSQGPVRAKLWIDIDRALSALEFIEKRVVRADGGAPSAEASHSREDAVS